MITQISEHAQSGMDELTSFADLSVLNAGEDGTVSEQTIRQVTTFTLQQLHVRGRTL